MVIEDEALDISRLYKLANVGDLVVTRFHNQQVASVTYQRIKLVRIVNVARKDDALALGFDKVGIGMPIARVGFAEVVVVDRADADAFVLEKKSVRYLVLCDPDAATLAVGVGDQLDRGELLEVGNENIVAVRVDMLGLFDARDLVDGENEVGKSADVVDVHMRNEDRADALNVDSRGVSRVRSVFSRIEPIIYSVYFKNERAMMASCLGLCARASAEKRDFDHFYDLSVKYSIVLRQLRIFSAIWPREK